jgi:hypothetical protein
MATAKCVAYTTGFFCMLGFGLIIVILGQRDYREHHLTRLQKYETAKNYYMDICKDPHKVQKMDVANECKEREKTLMRDPSLYALYDVLEEWNICRSGCGGILEGFSWGVWKLFIVIFVIYIVWLSLCGVNARREFRMGELANLHGFGYYYGDDNKKKQS